MPLHLPLERWLALAVHAAFVASFFATPPGTAVFGVICAALAAIASRLGWTAIAQYGGVAGLMGLLHASPLVAGTWPLPALLALGLTAAVARRAAPEALGWWRRGVRGPGDLPLAGLFVLVPGAALWSWKTLASPDLSDLAARFGGHALALYAVGALGFAMLNALAEEALFRGVAWQALERATGSVRWTLALQGAAFGLAHINGFPRGLSGVLLATVYGLMMGELRRRTGGLLLPWAAHVCADSVIAALLVPVVYAS